MKKTVSAAAKKMSLLTFPRHNSVCCGLDSLRNFLGVVNISVKNYRYVIVYWFPNLFIFTVLKRIFRHSDKFVVLAVNWLVSQNHLPFGLMFKNNLAIINFSANYLLVSSSLKKNYKKFSFYVIIRFIAININIFWSFIKPRLITTVHSLTSCVIYAQNPYSWCVGYLSCGELWNYIKFKKDSISLSLQSSIMILAIALLFCSLVSPEVFFRECEKNYNSNFIKIHSKLLSQKNVFCFNDCLKKEIDDIGSLVSRNYFSFLSESRDRFIEEYCRFSPLEAPDILTKKAWGVSRSVRSYYKTAKVEVDHNGDDFSKYIIVNLNDYERTIFSKCRRNNFFFFLADLNFELNLISADFLALREIFLKNHSKLISDHYYNNVADWSYDALQKDYDSYDKKRF